MSGDTATQNQFQGWAVVELFGHQKIAGMCRMESFGMGAMLRVDVPSLDEREIVIDSPRYEGGVWCEVGTKIKRCAAAGYTRILGIGAIYAINPCSEETAMRAVESLLKPEIKVVDLVERARPAIAPADEDDEDDVPY